MSRLVTNSQEQKELGTDFEREGPELGKRFAHVGVLCLFVCVCVCACACVCVF
jgi:hypothetical protein